MISVSAEYKEEVDPIPLAPNFTLRDYDSPDTPSTPHTVTLTLTQAVDEDSEGVQVEITSGGIQVRDISTEQYTKVYELSNGTSFSEYQQVCW